MGDYCRNDGAYEEDGDEQYVITPLPDAPSPSPPPGEPSRDGVPVAFNCEYEGAIGGLTSSIFRVRVLNDATLEGDVLRPRSNKRRHKQQYKRPKLSTSMVRRANGDAGGAAAVDRDGLVVYARLQGRVKPILSSLSANKRAPSLHSNDAYCCYFDVLPDTQSPNTEDEEDEEEAEVIACHVHFSPQKGDLLGHWVLHREKPFWITGDVPCELYNQELKQVFQLKRLGDVNVQAVKEDGTRSTALKHENPNLKTEDHKQTYENDSNRLKLYPLTPGLYEFRGFSTIALAPVLRPSRTTSTTSSSPSRRRRRSRSDSAQPTKDECFVTLRLLPGGALKGTSRELLRPQSCKVTGTWRADRVRYTLEYQVRGEVGLFRYSGRIEGDRKVLGKWKNVDEGHQEGYDGGKGEFELELTQAARLNQLKKSTGGGGGQEIVELDDEDEDDDGLAIITNNRICVLTTGVFTLKGCATDDDGYEYACELVVHLLPGGSLVGTSRELIFDQTHRIEGTWTPRSLSYDQKYVVKGAVGEYEYAGVVDADGGIINGVWNNKEVQDQKTLGEKGTFAYGIVEAHRVWTTFSHLWYPQSFQNGVLLLLLCSSRTHALPSSLWHRLFEFCHESWFVYQKIAGAVIKKLEG